MTADVKTIQGFASSGVLGILVDLLTIVGMLGLMFWLDWDFALIAVAVTPFLLLFVARFNKAVKKATHEVRKRQSDIVAVVQQGLEPTRVVKAYGRQDLEEERLAAGEPRDGRGGADGAARQVAAVAGGGAHRGRAARRSCCGAAANLVVAGAMTIGALTVFLTYLSKFFKPVQDLAKMSNTIAQTAVGLERIQTILDADDVLPEKPDAREPGDAQGRDRVRACRLRLRSRRRRCCAT